MFVSDVCECFCFPCYYLLNQNTMSPESTISRQVNRLPDFEYRPCPLWLYPQRVPGIDFITFYEPTHEILVDGQNLRPQVFSVGGEMIVRGSATIYHVKPSSQGSVGQLLWGEDFSLKMEKKWNGVDIWPWPHFPQDGQSSFRGKLLTMSTEEPNCHFVDLTDLCIYGDPFRMISGLVLLPVIAVEEDQVSGLLLINDWFFKSENVRSFLKTSLREGIRPEQIRKLSGNVQRRLREL